jgi:hypothetical protein
VLGYSAQRLLAVLVSSKSASDETPPADPAVEASAKHPHRRLALFLATVASVLAFLAIFSLWVNRQLLNTDNWTSASSQLLQEPAVREQLSIYLVDQLYQNVDVEGQIREALPPRAAPLAGAAAGGLKQLAQRASYEVLGRPRAQGVWEGANRRAHARLLNIVEGGGDVVSTDQGTVTLDLKALLGQTEDRVGVGGGLQQKLPEDAAQLTIMKSDQLGLAQDIVKFFKALPILLLALALGLYAVAIRIARDRRRETLRACGIGLLVAGVAALITRSLGGDVVVDALAKSDAVRPAADATWTIATSLLKEAAVATILYGIVVIVAAWLSGHTHAAVATRRQLAPYLREPRYAYGGFCLLVLLLLVWGPTPATRKFLPALILIALLAAGFEILRRQAAREYPDASIEESTRHAREWFGDIGHRLRGTSLHGSQATNGGDRLAELERAGELRDAGVLDAAEFEREKARILGLPSAPAAH